MTKQVEFRFACPRCGEPWATTVEDTVDIHGGHMYTCRDCSGYVIFAVEWPATDDDKSFCVLSVLRAEPLSGPKAGQVWWYLACACGWRSGGSADRKAAEAKAGSHERPW